MKNDYINEASSAPNIDGTDENVVLNQIYMKLSLPSLGRSIFGFTKIHGPTGGVFAIKAKDTGDGIELLRNNITVNDNVSNSISISQEAFDDWVNTYGEDVKERIVTHMGRYANIDENDYCIKFLKNNSKLSTALTLTNPLDPDIVWMEIAYKATQLVLEANMSGRITFNSYLVVPYKYAASIIAMYPKMVNQNNHVLDDMYAGNVAGMAIYINPDAEDDNVYVGLRDDEIGRCSAIFTSYYDKIVGPVADVKTGNHKYFIFKRFAITTNPLHTDTTPMMFKFKVN